jgi:anti-sigma regulatory factor (Ser/Thr protein kinase)
MTGAGSLVHAPATEVLKFRTGSVTSPIPCTVRLLDDSAGRGMVLVVADGGLEGGPPRAALPSSVGSADGARAFSPGEPALGRPPLTSNNTGMPLSDAETLREIARRIRQGSAGASNANDAPSDDHDLIDGRTSPRGPVANSPGRPAAPDVDWPEHLAHEIRTPLAAIVSLAEVITEERLGAWPNERYRGYIRDILDSARHGLDVVDGILRDVPERQGTLPLVVETDLNAEVDALCTSLQPLADKSSARLQAALVSGMPRVIADPRNVRQMLLNLITNSIKHSGGPVRIKVTTGYELAGEMWVEVEDDGPGFAAAVTGGGAPDKSARGMAQSRKTGFGLPLTSSLASANGARLDISSRPGGGVRARIVFGRDRVGPARD